MYQYAPPKPRLCSENMNSGCRVSISSISTFVSGMGELNFRRLYSTGNVHST